MQQIIENWGSFAIFIVALFDGEIPAVVGGFWVTLSLTNLLSVIVFATLANVITDNYLFSLGARHPQKFTALFPRLTRFVDTISQWTARSSFIDVVLARFCFGLRYAAPIAFGARGMSRPMFCIANCLGAFIWNTLLAGLGLLIGRTILEEMGTSAELLIRLSGLTFVIVLAVAVVRIIVLRFLERRKEHKETQQ